MALLAPSVNVMVNARAVNAAASRALGILRVGVVSIRLSRYQLTVFLYWSKGW